MDKNVSIKRNAFMNTFLTMSSFVFPLITFPYISRVLLPEGVGRVSLATSVIAYFSMFAQLGIPTYGIRACAQVRENKIQLSKTAHELLFINLFTTTIAYIALFFTVCHVERFNVDKALYFIISATILFQAIGMEWLYKGLEQYSYITIRSIIFKIIAVIAMFLLVRKKSDYVVYGGISVFAASASNLFNLMHAHKYISFKPFKKYDLRKHIKPIVVFFAMACATAIYVHLDTIMLGLIKTDAAVGYYNAAVKIRTILLSAVTSLGAVLLPRTSYYVKNNMMNEFKRISTKAMNFTIVIALPVTIYFCLFARQGIVFLSGTAFEKSVIPMQLIMPTVLLAGISNITGIEILIPLGKERVVLYSEIAGAITDLIINFLLIPSMGCAGAAIGTTVAEVVVLVFQIVCMKEYSAIVFRNVNYLKIGIASIISSISVVWVINLNINAFISLVISGSLFFMVYFILLCVLKEPIVIEICEMIFTKMRLKK